MKIPRAAGLLMAGLLMAPQARAYYGRSSIQAWLTFDGKVEVSFEGRLSAAELNGEGPLREMALALVRRQTRYLIGLFQSESFVREFGWPGTLALQDTVRFTGVERGGRDGRLRLSYRYRGKSLFHKDAFRGADRRPVPITLPLVPDEIYESSRGGGRKHPCTDAHYNDEPDFWYFWDPDKPGCGLQGDTRRLLRVEGALRKIDNTRLTYPNYDKLFGDNGNGELFQVSVFFGFINTVTKFAPKDMMYKDDAYLNMKALEERLESWGFFFNRRESLTQFRLRRDGRRMKAGGNNYLRIWEKHDRFRGRPVHLRVALVLTDTDSGSRDATFHQLLVPALERSDVLVYDGHAGTGDNLDLDMEDLRRTRLDPDKYQVIFFNGCTTYPWFTGMYFDARGGRRNMEIVTAGLVTYAETSAANVSAFLDSFLKLKPLSYQTILGRLDASIGEGETYLYGVSGDEHNRWRP